MFYAASASSPGGGRGSFEGGETKQSTLMRLTSLRVAIGTVGWEPGTHPFRIEKTELFPRVGLSFVHDFVLEESKHSMAQCPHRSSDHHQNNQEHNGTPDTKNQQGCGTILDLSHHPRLLLRTCCGALFLIRLGRLDCLSRDYPIIRSPSAGV